VARHAAEQTGRRYVSVRFGNVVGGRTSVFELFVRQIDAGGPVTITDPIAARYWMTLSEAVSLMLIAARHQPTRHVGVLDMGEPRTLSDIASELMAVMGRQVPVEVIGLQRGEKQREVLLSPEEARFVRPLYDGDGVRLPVDVVAVVPVSPPEERQMASRLARGAIDVRLRATGLTDAWVT
jgi:FlaA1/EpsC-like NDP-sugar epimerase